MRISLERLCLRRTRVGVTLVYPRGTELLDAQLTCEYSQPLFTVLCFGVESINFTLQNVYLERMFLIIRNWCMLEILSCAKSPVFLLHNLLTLIELMVYMDSAIWD